ncbi:hypothetical protein G7Y89_g9072 [Cudoniella acicularis]|uniref:Uncharacterized protein n=1 Tax=Cudoniella acicularis TaxID=354080 RepID=A0A8H4RI09_9HELO|nr:hypothetical protein G7Y89_g9072 [Cudoniella acicularis]
MDHSSSPAQEGWLPHCARIEAFLRQTEGAEDLSPLTTPPQVSAGLYPHDWLDPALQSPVDASRPYTAPELAAPAVIRGSDPHLSDGLEDFASVPQPSIGSYREHLPDGLEDLTSAAQPPIGSFYEHLQDAQDNAPNSLSAPSAQSLASAIYSQNFSEAPAPAPEHPQDLLGFSDQQNPFDFSDQQNLPSQQAHFGFSDQYNPFGFSDQHNLPAQQASFDFSSFDDWLDDYDFEPNQELDFLPAPAAQDPFGDKLYPEVDYFSGLVSSQDQHNLNNFPLAQGAHQYHNMSSAQHNLSLPLGEGANQDHDMMDAPDAASSPDEISKYARQLEGELSAFLGAPLPPAPIANNPFLPANSAPLGAAVAAAPQPQPQPQPRRRRRARQAGGQEPVRTASGRIKQPPSKERPEYGVHQVSLTETELRVIRPDYDRMRLEVFRNVGPHGKKSVRITNREFGLLNDHRRANGRDLAARSTVHTREENESGSRWLESNLARQRAKLGLPQVDL